MSFESKQIKLLPVRYTWRITEAADRKMRSWNSRHAVCLMGELSASLNLRRDSHGKAKNNGFYFASLLSRRELWIIPYRKRCRFTIYFHVVSRGLYDRWKTPKYSLFERRSQSFRFTLNRWPSKPFQTLATELAVKSAERNEPISHRCVI